MGGNESRCFVSSKHKKTNVDQRGDVETEEFLKDVTEMKSSVVSKETDSRSLDFPTIGQPILDFAQKTSKEIISQALQLCWEAEIRYKDLPFIDECEYVI